MNKQDFHIPFLHSLVLIASFTLVSMVLAHIFVPKYFFSAKFTPSFTHIESGPETNTIDNKGF